MQLTVGSIVEGKVTGITKFGAFIELPEGKTGMVHISEIAPTYVNEIKDHLTENQVVKVKVLNITEEGKISLSIKRAQEGFGNRSGQHRGGPNGGQNRGFQDRNRTYQPNRKPAVDRFDASSNVWTPKKTENLSFEDMMSKFKQTSDDKMSDLKKYIDTKRGSGNRKSPNR